MKLLKKEKDFIGQVSETMQAGGMTKAASRIIGYLLICEKGTATFDEIMNDLGLSKGSTSQTLNLLQQSGFVEKTSVAGMRKKRYQLCNPSHQRFIQARIQAIQQSQALFLEAKALNAVAGRSRQQPVINAIIRFNDFMVKELTDINQKWASQ